METQLNYYNEYSVVQDVVRNNSPSKEIFPHFEGFQLIGDSLFCRFANEVLNQPWKVVDGVRLVGHCVSGQRIDQLRQRIKKNVYPLASRVIVLIGTNDVLCGGETQTMIRHFKRLLKLLLKKNVKKLVILTLPPIPKFCVSFSHWSVIRTYNEFLKGLDNKFNIIVYDICPLYTKFTCALEFEITEEYPSLRRTFSSSSEIRTDSPVTSRSSSNSSSLDRKKSPFVNVKRSFDTPMDKKKNDLCNKLHRSRKSQEIKAKEETKFIDESNVTVERKLIEVEETKSIKKKKYKVKERKAEIIEISDSDEDTSDSDSCMKSSDVPSSELPAKEKVTEVEIPAVKKGTKRKVRVKNAEIDDNGNLAFNNNGDESLISEGGPSTKKRKIEISAPEPESLSPSKELRKKLADPGRVGAMIFSKALKDTIKPDLKKNNVSPSKRAPDKSIIEKIKKLSPKVNDLKDKSLEVKKENETVVATDKWETEICDDDTSVDMAYNSQDEEESKSNDEESFCKTASPGIKPNPLSGFKNYIDKMNGEDYLDKMNGEDISDLDDDDDNITNIIITKENNNIKEESLEEEIERKETEDISDGEIFDDDDVYKQETETDSQTSDDGSHQKQMWPFIEFQFAELVKRDLNLVSTVEGTSEVVSYTNFLNQAYNFEPAPQALSAQRFSNESYSPLAMPPINSHQRYGAPPYFYCTPPSSVLSTPPPMPSPVNFSAGDFNQTGKLDLEGLQARDKNIVELSKYIVTLDSYEVLYTFGQKRLDMIHLNVHGLTQLKKFLSQQIANL